MAADKSKKLLQLGCTAPGMDMINAFMRGFVEGRVSPLIKRTMSNNGPLLAFDRLLSSVRDGHALQVLVAPAASGAGFGRVKTIQDIRDSASSESPGRARTRLP